MTQPIEPHSLALFLKACRCVDVEDALYYLSQFRMPDEGGEAALQEMRKALRSELPEVRTRGDWIMRAFGPEALSSLTAMLDEGDRDKRWFAIARLQSIGLPQAADGLIKALDGSNPEEYLCIAHEFGCIVNKSPLSFESISRLVEIFSRFLRKDYGNLRFPLRAYDDPNYINNIQFHICGCFMELGVAAREAVPALVGLLQDETAARHIKQDAARALGNIGSPEAVPALINALSKYSDDPNWRVLLSDSLRRIGESGGIPPIPAKGELIASEWDVEAAQFLRQLKVFYLLGRLYKEGKTSIRSVTESLKRLEGQLFKEDLPTTNVSFSDNAEQLAELFSKILKKERFAVFIKRSGFGNILSDDAWQAWEWTDAFLRRYLPSDWFGFSRLSPLEKPESTS